MESNSSPLARQFATLTTRPSGPNFFKNLFEYKRTRGGFAVVDDVAGRIESQDFVADATGTSRLELVFMPEHVQSGQTTSVIQLTFI